MGTRKKSINEESTIYEEGKNGKEKNEKCQIF